MKKIKRPNGALNFPLRVFTTLVLFISGSLLLTGQKTYQFPFLNPELSFEDRATDLVGRMTLEEKISQMMNAAPAIPRLEIPEYNWWNECLHGVARAGIATVFPQAIGLGATWDEDLIFRVSTAISDEARAKHHEFIRHGKRLIYQGLTFWTPNINIFRDPRWGRGQETYGEDPFLTGRLGVQFIKGLQGNDPKYFKTIATVKHYAVHSGPEPERHSFDAITDERDLRETYLPQFEMGVKEGKAYSVMCAYNRYLGQACCGSDYLLNDILRHEWGFNGYIVSDCGAITDIYKGHNVVSSPQAAAALAVKSGTDLECATVYFSLKQAVSENLITEQELDVSVKRLFIARFRLGMFDPPEMVPYSRIPYSVVDSKKNKELAKQAALESMVLLKNMNGILPLRKDIGTVAVIGPNADQVPVLLGNYNGTPSDPITPLRGIKEKLAGKSEVLYAKGSELAEGLLVFDVIPENFLYHEGDAKGLRADYFNNKDFQGDILFSDISRKVDVNWEDKAPRENMDADNFGVRWTGELRPEHTGTYYLGVSTTCKINLYLNDSLVVNTAYHFRDEYSDPRLSRSQALHFDAGKKYRIKIEAGESYGDARLQLMWCVPSETHTEELKQQAVETAKKADVVILCMGISAGLEGEEMNVFVDGFRGGDRTKIDLPDMQQNLIKAVYATGKPIILVLLNGSAIAINWENQSIPAILEAWYPGQAGGEAIADVLFGDYNPAGRLPVTFYKSLKDLPPFEDYNMANRTYRYFKGEPLYSFGYGLSYTTFAYSKFKIKKNVSIGDTLKITVNVKNTGKLAGDEVVQLYLSNSDSLYPTPIRTLKAFQRVHLLPGEIKTLSFLLSPGAFSVINDKFKKIVLPGEFMISVGGKQPVLTGITKEGGILKSVIKLGEK
jgi:beta-glucosidase